MKQTKKTLLALQSLLPAEMAQLGDHFHVIRLWEERNPEQAIMDNRFTIAGIVSTYNCAGVSKRLIEALPNLEIIAQFGAGFDNIDLAAAYQRKIVVTNTPDVLTDDTADLAMILLLSVARRAVEADMYVRVGRWQSAGAFPLSTSISGKTVGIVGLGKIGMAIAQRAQAFNAKVVYHGRKRKEGISLHFYDSLIDMAGESDFLVLACAGGEGTKNLVNYEVLQALGARGYLINIARGSVVNEGDLLIALRNRTIAGAGLDVFAQEPNIPVELIKMDNVVLSPHVGSATMETRGKMGQLVIQNLLAYFDGNSVLTPVKYAG